MTQDLSVALSCVTSESVALRRLDSDCMGSRFSEAGFAGCCQISRIRVSLFVPPAQGENQPACLTGFMRDAMRRQRKASEACAFAAAAGGGVGAGRMFRASGG
jgi:hypothetical protein